MLGNECSEQDTWCGKGVVNRNNTLHLRSHFIHLTWKPQHFSGSLLTFEHPFDNTF